MSILLQFIERLYEAREARGRAFDLLPHRALDCLAALIAGAATSEGRDLAANGPLSPLGESPLDCIARAVGFARLSEVDDIHLRSCTTPGAVIVPVVFGLADLAEAGPGRAAAALLAGYEAMVRFGEAVDGPNILYRGVWPTYLAGPVGAAAAASVLFNLDAEAAARALSLALAQMSGALGRPTGKPPRWLLAGLAARAGCLAALAARQGFGADLALLDGDWLGRTHGLACQSELLTALREPAVLQLSCKPYCGARQTMAASEAFRRILEKGVGIDDVVAVRVFVPTVYVAMIRQAPNSRSGRIVSVAYQLALAACRPESLWDVERAELDDARVSAFMQKIETRADPALDELYPGMWPARVEVETARRERFAETVEAARGDPDRSLDEPDLMLKFRKLVEPIEGRRRCEELARLALRALSEPRAFAALSAEFKSRARGTP